MTDQIARFQIPNWFDYVTLGEALPLRSSPFTLLEFVFPLVATPPLLCNLFSFPLVCSTFQFFFSGSQRGSVHDITPGISLLKFPLLHNPFFSPSFAQRFLSLISP